MKILHLHDYLGLGVDDMSTISDYKILRAMSPEELESLVIAYLQKGWKPIGGVTASIIDDAYFLQAIVKKG